eukprot:superscaffoldBa00001740_g11818
MGGHPFAARRVQTLQWLPAACISLIPQGFGQPAQGLSGSMHPQAKSNWAGQPFWGQLVEVVGVRVKQIQDRETAGMMRDSVPPAVERPGLEDVAEEEDVFAAEVIAKSSLLPGSCQVPRGKAEMEEGQLSVSQVEAEFAQLTFRKQVSYR